MGAARSSTSTWSFKRMSSAPGRMRHLASGLRRQVPVPEQGASISTRSALALMSASGSASALRARQRLAAGAGAEIDHLLTGLRRRKQCRELRALVLHLDRALDEILFGM